MNNGDPKVKIMKHKNRMRKLLSLLTIISLLAGSAIDVSAAGTGAPRITFTNEPNDSPDLRITKKVTSLAAGAQAPAHAKFQFVLKLDLNGDGTAEIAPGVAYTLSDRNGEIVRRSGGRVVDFETSSNGVFELEDGQTATFKNVGNRVAYEVTERSNYLYPKTEGDGFKVDPNYEYCRKTVTMDGDKEEITYPKLRDEYVYEERGMAKYGYELLSPQGGSSGNVVPDMGTIVFENQYTPENVSSTELKVTKTVSYPTEYEMPQAIKDTKFWFRLELSGSAGREYSVQNPVSDSVETVRLTDSEGRFYLYPGETAVFADVNGNEGYRVEEILEEPEEVAPGEPDPVGQDDTDEDEAQEPPDGGTAQERKVCPDGWWPTGAAVKEGDRIPASPVTFNNANTSFRVRKTMEDNTEPDVEFTFQLVDAQNNPLGGETYYRYGILSQEMIMPEPQPGTQSPAQDPQGWSTDANGYFRLKPGEEAVFCGIPQGSTYTVKEIGRLIEKDGVIKVDPSYAEQPPQEVSVSSTGLLPTLHFVNSPMDVQGTLTVTKHVENAEAEGSATDEDFHFLLYKVGKGGEEDELVDDAVFIIVAGDKEENYATGQKDRGWDEGEFAIKAGQTARFATLSADATYRVEEVKLTSEYIPKLGDGLESGGTKTEESDGVTQTVAKKADGSYEYTQTGTMDEDGLAFTFTNLYKPKKVDIKISKVSDQDAPLAGAEFMLYLNKGKEDKVLPEAVKSLPKEEQDAFRYTTEIDQDGGDKAPATVTIGDLKPGTYWLYEEKAPSGYRLLPEPIEIQIAQTQDGLRVTIDGTLYLPDNEAVTVGSDTLKSVKVTAGSGEAGSDGKIPNDEIELTIPNLYFYELPNSGGMGIYWYSIGGMLLMMAAALILYRYKLRGEVLRD